MEVLMSSILRLNDEDIITASDQTWEEYLKIDQPDPFRMTIIGRSIWDFIDIEINRELLKKIFFDVRASEKEAKIDYWFPRKPDTLCQLNIFSSSKDACSLSISSTPIVKDGTPVKKRFTGDVLRACCACPKVFFENSWINVAEFINMTDFMCGSSACIGVTHTYCGACFEKVMGLLNSLV